MDLNVHTLWALLQRRPWVLQEEPDLVQELLAKTEALLDEDEDVSAQSRREAESLRYAVTMMSGR